jgi:hypothetical protein
MVLSPAMTGDRTMTAKNRASFFICGLAFKLSHSNPPPNRFTHTGNSYTFQPGMTTEMRADSVRFQVWRHSFIAVGLAKLN